MARVRIWNQARAYILADVREARAVARHLNKQQDDPNVLSSERRRYRAVRQGGRINLQWRVV